MAQAHQVHCPTAHSLSWISGGPCRAGL